MEMVIREKDRFMDSRCNLLHGVGRQGAEIGHSNLEYGRGCSTPDMEPRGRSDTSTSLAGRSRADKGAASPPEEPPKLGASELVRGWYKASGLFGHKRSLKKGGKKRGGDSLRRDLTAKGDPTDDDVKKSS